MIIYAISAIPASGTVQTNLCSAICSLPLGTITDLLPAIAAVGWIVAIGAIVFYILSRKKHLAAHNAELERLKKEAADKIKAEAEARLAAEAKVQQVTDHITRIIKLLPIPVAIFRTRDNRLASANHAFSAFVGRSLDKLANQSQGELNLWVNSSDSEIIFSDTQRTGTLPAHECMLRNHEGIRQTIISAGIIDIAATPHLLMAILDGTERNSLLTQVRHLQKMEAIGDLAAGIAHDLNNMLTVVHGYLSLMKENDYFNADDKNMVGIMLKSTNRASALSKQLLTYSHKPRLQERSLQVNDVVQQLRTMFEPLFGRSIKIETQLATDLPSFLGDESLLEQVFVNLAVNARDSMPRGGIFRMESALCTIKPGETTLNPEARPGSFIHLLVSDNGAGMDDVTRSKLFEPFFTTKESSKRTGLGMATAYGIIRQHRGWIDVDSSPGKGTAFHIYLPVENTAPAPSNEQAAPGSPRTHETILVVEDEAGIRMLFVSYLAKRGYHILEAENGSAALKLAREHNGPIDLLFTDVVMPDGVNGIELAEILHKERPQMHIIFATGYTHKFATEHPFKKRNILSKPFELPTLLKTVQNILAQPPH